MKLKKMISLTTCMMTIMTILIGCNNHKITREQPSIANQVVTLKYYTIGTKPDDYQEVINEVNDYLEDKINVNLDITFFDFNDYSQKLSVVINSLEPFDLAFTCSWAGDYLNNARKGAFLELDSYLDTIGKEMKEAIDYRFWDGTKVDGKIYAVPTQKELGIAPMWAFTKEYVDKYHIPFEEIHALEDLEPWLQLIKENESHVIPLYVTKGFSYSMFFDEIVGSVGILLKDENDLQVVNLFETEEMKKTLSILRRYYEAGYINLDSATAQDDRSVKRFVTKGDGQPYVSEIWSENLGYSVVTSSITSTWITNASTTESMVAISSYSKNKEKAIKFLNLLNTDPIIRNLLNYGLEDIHYEKIDDNRIKLINKKAYDVPYFSLGNLFITYVTENEPDTKWEEFKVFNNESKNSPILGFKFDSSSVSKEVAAIENVLEEFEAILYSGSVDVDEYLEKLNHKLKQQGIDKIIEEAQKQLDEWASSKSS